MRESAGNDDRVDTLGRRRRRATAARRAPPSCSIAYIDVELAVRAREHDDTDRGTVTRSTTSYASITGLARRRSHISFTCARAAVGIGRVDHEVDRLADVHLRDVRVAERGQRPLDRRARRIGDAGQVRDFDVRVEHRHDHDATDPLVVVAVPVGEREVGDELVGLDVLRAACWRSRRRAAAARAARGSSPSSPCKSRTYCLSNDGGDGAGPVLVPRPVARRVGRHHLVDDDDVVVALTELELRVGEDQAAALGVRARRARTAAARGPSAARTRRRRRASTASAGGQRHVVAALGLRRRREQRLGQLVGLPQPRRHREPTDRALLLVLVPAAARTRSRARRIRAGSAGPRARAWRGPATSPAISGKSVGSHEITWLATMSARALEPEVRQRGEHAALVGDEVGQARRRTPRCGRSRP